MCVPAHGCPWVQENTGVSITVKLYVYMLVCVWSGVHVKEQVRVHTWASAAQGMFECETAGMHYTYERV